MSASSAEVVGGAKPVAPVQRLVSVDALRGFDMFWIVGGDALFVAFIALFINPVPEWLTHQLDHVPWEGFVAWDLIMPLFLFVSGAAMPFSFLKWSESGQSQWHLWRRIIRRVILLWILGMMVQGKFFEYDLSTLRLYSNTLQAIAAGYVITTIAMLCCCVRGQIVFTAALLIAFWLLMMFVPVPGHGAGMLEPKLNLAMYVDETLLGHFRDGTTYTWILSSLGFGASVLMGALGGHVLQNATWSGNRKSAVLLAAGVGCLAAGWIWGIWFPIIKHIWTSSMVLWAGGLSYLLLAAFYWVIDVQGIRKWAFPLVILGMNAIAVYVAAHLIDFKAIASVFVGNLAERWGVFGSFLLAFTTFMIPWLILLYMYKKKTFVRV